jgi:hypothetical protein
VPPDLSRGRALLDPAHADDERRHPHREPGSQVEQPDLRAPRTAYPALARRRAIWRPRPPPAP